MDKSLAFEDSSDKLILIVWQYKNVCHGLCQKSEGHVPHVLTLRFAFDCFFHLGFELVPDAELYGIINPKLNVWNDPILIWKLVQKECLRRICDYRMNLRNQASVKNYQSILQDL